MNVGLALEIDESIYNLSSVVIELSDCLQDYFKARSYGADVENFTIGVILTTPDIDHLHPIQPLRYRRRMRFSSPKIELNNVVEYDIRASYEVFSQLSPPQARAYVARLLIESIGTLEANRKKFPSFDVSKFTADFTACLSTPPRESAAQTAC